MLFRHSAIYASARLVSSLCGLLLIAALTRALNTEQVGHYFLVVSCVFIAQCISTIWISASTSRFIQKYDDHEALLGNALFLYRQVVAGVAGITLVAVLALSDPYYRMLVLAGFALFVVTSWIEIALQVMVARTEAVQNTIFTLMRSLLTLLFGASLAWIGWGAPGALVGSMIGTIIPAVMIYRRDWRGVPIQISAVRWREFLAFGLPISFNGSIGSLAAVTDRFMVGWLEGAAALGLYAVGFELAQRVMRAVMDPIGIASRPLAVHALEKSGPEQAAVQLRENLVLLLATALPVTAGSVAVANDIAATVVGDSFRSMTEIVFPIIILSCFLTGFCRNYLDHAFHLGMKTKWQVIISSASITSNTILNFILIKEFGAVGAAYATVMTATVVLGLYLLLGRAVYALPLLERRLLPIVLASTVMFLAVSAVPLAPGWPGLVTRVTVGAIVYGSLALAFDIMGIRGRLMRLAARRRNA